jgi:hypothetical protein
MAPPRIVPGLIIKRGGIYRVSHSTGHLPDAEFFILKNTLLPNCHVGGCHLEYTLIRPASEEREDDDFKEN